MHFLKLRNCGGFLLMEIMISLSIVAIAIVGVLHSLRSSMDAEGMVEDYSTASVLAQDSLSKLEREAYLPVGKTTGAFTGENSRFSWRQAIKSTKDSALREVVLTIYWKRHDQKEQLALRTLLPTENLSR